MRYVFLSLFIFIFSHSIYSAQYEMELLDYLKSKYLGKKIVCIDSKYKNYKFRNSVKKVFQGNDFYYVELSNKVVCKFNFFTIGMNRTDLNRNPKKNSQGQQAVMDNHKFLNSMLQNLGDQKSSLPNQVGSYNIEQAQLESGQKNNWTSKSEIHYTELNSNTNKKSKVRITTEGIYIDYYKIGITFEREISKEKN